MTAGKDRQHGEVEQLVAYRVHAPKVGGSSPPFATSRMKRHDLKMIGVNKLKSTKRFRVTNERAGYGKLGQLMHEYNGFSIAANKGYLRDAIDSIKQMLCDGKEVMLPGFGTFSIRRYQNHNNGLMEKWGKTTMDKYYYVVRFRTGNQFKAAFGEAAKNKFDEVEFVETEDDSEADIE